MLLGYLDLPSDYSPNPDTDPIGFLKLHIRQLPGELLKKQFALTTTPVQRNVIPCIRDRRAQFLQTHPDLSSLIRDDVPPINVEQEGQEEADWADHVGFLQGKKGHVGKLGHLLGNYQQERSAKESISQKRMQAKLYAEDDFIPEEDSDSSSDDGTGDAKLALKEHRDDLFSGQLKGIDYDAIDWDENLDVDSEREQEQRWFDQDDEDD